MQSSDMPIIKQAEATGSPLMPQAFSEDVILEGCFDPYELSDSNPKISEMTRSELSIKILAFNYTEKAVTNQLFNSFSHLFGSILSLLFTFLVIKSALTVTRHWLPISSLAVFGGGLVLVFLASTCHHGLGLRGYGLKWYRIFRILDHTSIFILIAASFCPICIIGINTRLSITLCAIVSFICIGGLVLRVCFPRKTRQWVFNTIYLTAGWGAIFLGRQFVSIAGLRSFLWCMAGGLAYTTGFVIFQLEAPNPIPGRFCSHEIWHVFVLIAALCHMAMVHAVLPGLERWADQ